MNEPRITINGTCLNEGQAMTIRVAIETLAESLEDGLGDDDMGKQICSGYQECIKQLRKLYLNSV